MNSPSIAQLLHSERALDLRAKVSRAESDAALAMVRSSKLSADVPVAVEAMEMSQLRAADAAERESAKQAEAEAARKAEVDAAQHPPAAEAERRVNEAGPRTGTATPWSPGA